MNRLRGEATSLMGLTLIERELREDHRGFLSRLFCMEELRPYGVAPFSVAQVNHTLTRFAGSIRGLHFQRPPQAESKLVTCLRGKVFDVSVDIRRGSPTFLRWHGEVLSRENLRGMLIPEGFAHGFQALEDDCELIYLHSRPYAAEAEGGLHPADPVLGIEWPLPLTDLSERDRSHPPLAPEFIGV